MICTQISRSAQVKALSDTTNALCYSHDIDRSGVREVPVEEQSQVFALEVHQSPKALESDGTIDFDIKPTPVRSSSCPE